MSEIGTPACLGASPAISNVNSSQSIFNAIIRFLLRSRGVIYVLVIVAACYGLYTLTRAKLDVFPEFVPPISTVHTEALGLTSEQVETLVTQPFENVLGGMVGLQSIHSRSVQGPSATMLVFDDHTNVLQVRQLVIERINGVAATLPTGAMPSRLLPLTTTASVVRIIGITSKTCSLMDLYDIARWIVRPQLPSVLGVVDVIVFGGDACQMQVQVDPAKLMCYGLSVQDVIVAACLSTGVCSAGFIENNNQRIAANADGRIATPQKLAGVVPRWSNGTAVRLGDVAIMVWDSTSPVGAVSIMGQTGVQLVLESQYGTNTPAIMKSIEKTLDTFGPVLVRHGVEVDAGVFRPANFIDTLVGHLCAAFIVGAVLMMAVLFLFLLNVCTVVIFAVAIPLSLLVVSIVLTSLGVGLNTMTFGGPAIALGEMVDDAIIDVENTYRRLRENCVLPQPLAVFHVVLRASLEVRSVVVFATFIMTLILPPSLALSGVAGKLLAPLGIAYILAVLALFVVVFTLVPVMTLALPTRRSLPMRESHWVVGLKASYTALLMKIEQHMKAVTVTVALMCVTVLVTLPFMSGNSIPQLYEGHYIMHMGLAPGTSLEESMRIGIQIPKVLMQVPGVCLVAQRVGRANNVVDPTDVQLSEFEIDLEPIGASDRSWALYRVRQALARFPGLITSVDAFLVERTDEIVSGATAPVIVNVSGNNLDVVNRTAQDIACLIGTIHGAVSMQVASPPGISESDVKFKPDQLSCWGFRPVEVLDTIQAVYAGVTVS